MWTGELQFEGGMGTAEFGLARYSLAEEGDGLMWTGEVQFGEKWG